MPAPVAGALYKVADDDPARSGMAGHCDKHDDDAVGGERVAVNQSRILQQWLIGRSGLSGMPAHT